MGIRKFIGNKDFYKKVLLISVPIMVQNGITNFVSLLDNIMVGQAGTDQMSGVSIVNQLIFVFNLAIFGGLSGAGIFGAQYYGKGQHEGVRNTFRFKLWTAIVVLIAAFAVFIGFGGSLIQMFLHEGSATGNVEATFLYAEQYLAIMLVGLVPFALNQCYVSTLRETGETVIPMIAGITAVFVNLILNCILIFGMLGAPALGVQGAAIATVTSRYVETLIIIIWTHAHTIKNQFIIGAYRSLQIPISLVKQIILKGLPLMINEILWACGVAITNQCYSTRGLATVAAININSTINNLFNVVFIALGSSVSIVVGQLLGANKMEEAKDTDNKLIAFSVGACIVIGGIMAVTAPLFPQLYNTTEEVRLLAEDFIFITAACMPLCAFTHATYFTLRSGGKTIVTFIFDSCFMCGICVPIAFSLSRYTDINIVLLYGICQSLEFVKCIIGFFFVKSNIWLHNIVEK